MRLSLLKSRRSLPNQEEIIRHPRNKHSFIIQCSNQPIHTLNPDRRKILLTGSLFAWSARVLSSPHIDAACASITSAEALQRRLESRVHEFTLSNGMSFLVSQRRTAPVVSFHTYVDVGAFDEDNGLTGVAHLLEHAISKGTARIGTKDYKKEALLLDAMDDVFYSMREATSGHAAAELAARLAALQAEAAELSSPNAYGALLQKEGAVGLNAQTTHDSTQYFSSLPSNKVELWFAMESERFRAPVFRDLYKEKNVVLEERKMRVDNSPLGPFQEEFAARSLTNNYKRPVIGYEIDIQRLGRREVAQFFNQHYGPSSVTVAVVGDVTPEQIRRHAETYFGQWLAGGTAGAACMPSRVSSQDGRSRAGLYPQGPGASPKAGGLLEEDLPRPEGPKTLRMQSKAGPAVLRAYYRPCIRDRSTSAAMDVLSDTLSGSRSSRLYKNIVLTGKALSATSFSSFPAEKHPSQMAVYGMPAPGISLDELDRLLQREVEDIVAHGPTEKELKRYVAASQVGVLDSMKSNSGFASLLNSYHALTGDWRTLCLVIADLEDLTPDKVRDGVAPYVYGGNSFVGYADVV